MPTNQKRKSPDRLSHPLPFDDALRVLVNTPPKHRTAKKLPAQKTRSKTRLGQS